MKFNTCALFAFGILAAVDAQELVEERSVKMKNKVCTGEPKRTLDSKPFKCKNKCLNFKWCTQVGFEFTSATGKAGTCHLYDVQSKMNDPVEGQRTKCGKILTEYVPAATPEPTSEPTSAPSSEPSTSVVTVLSFEKGARCNGDHYQTATNYSKSQCQSDCEADSSCTAYFMNLSKNKCFLYSNEVTAETVQHMDNDNIGCAYYAVETESPTSSPTTTVSPSASPSSSPSLSPSEVPSEVPSKAPTGSPTSSPSLIPSTVPSDLPSTSPTGSPSLSPSSVPSKAPTGSPTDSPSLIPSDIPSDQPSSSPTASPTASPTSNPTASPTSSPTAAPTVSPTTSPTASPTAAQRSVETCNVDLRLAYPHGEGYYDQFEKEAPYYGKHKDYMTVKYGDETCEGKDKDSIPKSWCEYGHTWDDYYENHDYYGAQHYYVTEAEKDAYYPYYYYSTAETMVIKEAAGKEFTIDVYHAFEDGNSYYAEGHEYYGYQYYDHNMAAHLSIEVGGEAIASDLHHEHDYNTDTHDYYTGEINEDYDNHFEVTVSCNDSCSCTAEYST